MSVKFKLAFTIDAETLLGIMSKFLPVENLRVEEVIELPPTESRGDVVHSLHPPRKVRETKGKLDAYKGINSIILKSLADGEDHVGSDCFPALKAAGYSVNGAYGKLNRLKEHGLVSVYKNKWRLTLLGKQIIDHAPKNAPTENAAEDAA
jgi:hypothetical protein